MKTVFIIVCCFAGIVAATLAYGEHFNTASSPCQINAVWDCGIVNHSPYATMRGIPIALFGILGYALIAVLAGRFPRVAAAAAAAGFCFSLRFTWIEWRVLQTWCLYCVSSQVMITIVLLLTVWAALGAQRGYPRR